MRKRMDPPSIRRVDDRRRSLHRQEVRSAESGQGDHRQRDGAVSHEHAIVRAQMFGTVVGGVLDLPPLINCGLVIPVPHGSG